MAVCTVVGSQGSTPQAAGATMLVHADLTTEGTLGGGCVEAEVRKQAFELLSRGASGLLQFRLDHDYGWDDGLICGGSMQVAVQTFGASERDGANAAADCGGATGGAAEDVAARVGAFEAAAADLAARRATSVPIEVTHEHQRQVYWLQIEAPARLIIAGAGHVGASLARLAVGLDFETRVIDDRADLMGPERLPAPIIPVVGDIEQALKDEAIDGETYVVIVTRGHKHDEQALHAVMGRGARYLGMIGSRRKVKLIFDDLLALGVDKAELERVHAPIGLAIGAVTVPEIAVSILAQLIQTRRESKPTRVDGPVVVGAMGDGMTASAIRTPDGSRGQRVRGAGIARVYSPTGARSGSSPDFRPGFRCAAGAVPELRSGF